MTNSSRGLAKCDDVTVYHEDGDVFVQMPSGEVQRLEPPFVPFGINAAEDLETNNDVARDAEGYAWTRRPVLACFSHNDQWLTVQWDLDAHEPRYGWEYSHARAMRKTWARLTIDDQLTWNWIETIDRPQQYWIHSAGDWPDRLKHEWPT